MVSCGKGAILMEATPCSSQLDRLSATPTEVTLFLQASLGTGPVPTSVLPLTLKRLLKNMEKTKSCSGDLLVTRQAPTPASMDVPCERAAQVIIIRQCGSWILVLLVMSLGLGMRALLIHRIQLMVVNQDSLPHHRHPIDQASLCSLG